MDSSGTAVNDGATVEDTCLVPPGPVAIAERTPDDVWSPGNDVDDGTRDAPPDLSTVREPSAEEGRVPVVEVGSDDVGATEGVASIGPRFGSVVTTTTTRSFDRMEDRTHWIEA